ncbi:MAG TPA: calcium-translocating P-type ATPase, PMCA-type, partial [Chroococcales cyanobacterium]
LSLALASRKLVKSKCLVRSMDAAETIGCVTVICSDKTGTLTKNQMNIEHFVLAQEEDCSDKKAFFALHEFWPVAFAVNSTAELQDEREVVGSSTEGAFLLALASAGIDYRKIREAHPVVERVPFRSDTKWMSTTVAIDVHHHHFIKGAPEGILEKCRKVETAAGIADFSEEMRGRFEAGIKEAADQAMRTLAFARREPGSDDFVLMGVAAIADPVREEIPSALATCRKAGISVKMITGDNPVTATAIARRIGLLSEGDLVLTGELFEMMSDEEVSSILTSLKVIARSRPADKKRLVELLQKAGETVAVTGDGTNDAPALKQADVGLSMGIAGTEVAKEASDLVLLDDNFATILEGIRWGRTLYQNIQRFVQFQLTVNVAALAIALFGPFIGVELPLTAVQLLWVNIIMDTLAGLALGSELPRKGIMDQTPIKRDASIVTPNMATVIGITSLYFFLVLSLLLKFPLGANPQTFFFTAFVFFQIWNELNARSLDLSSAFQQLRENGGFLGVMGLIVVVQVLLVNFGGAVFRTVPMGLSDWGVALLLTSSVLILAEAIRFALRLATPREEKGKVPQEA